MKQAKLSLHTGDYTIVHQHPFNGQHHRDDKAQSKKDIPLLSIMPMQYQREQRNKVQSDMSLKVPPEKNHEFLGPWLELPGNNAGRIIGIGHYKKQGRCTPTEIADFFNFHFI